MGFSHKDFGRPFGTRGLAVVSPGVETPGYCRWSLRDRGTGVHYLSLRDRGNALHYQPAVTLELNATPEEVMRAVDALEQFCREKHVPEKVIFGLALALEECGSNIVNHAYRRDPQQKFKIAFEHTGNTLNIELRDTGPEFDPIKAAPTPINEHDDRPPGGWGMHLVRHYTDEISYRRENGVNILRLTKRLFG